MTRYNATVAELDLCHCLKTQNFPLRGFTSANWPIEWPMARLSIDFPSVASSFAQKCLSSAVERTLSGQRLTETWLETRGRLHFRQRQSLPHCFRALVQSKHCIDSLDGFILNL